MSRSGRTEVVAAVIERGGLFLVAQRPAHKHHGGLWEFPGGKVSGSESLADALARELTEELGVRLHSCGTCLYLERDPASGLDIHFIEAEIEGEPMLLEHSDIKWCSIAELTMLSLAPADARFARRLLAGSACRSGATG